MKNYFILQQKRFNRKIVDFGLPLILGYIILPILFIAFSISLFEKTEFAKYIYVFTGLSLVFKFSEINRNNFLKSIFSKEKYIKIRLLENLIFTTPFLIFLVYKKLYLFAFILGISSLFLVLFNLNFNSNFTLPTPFWKKPFEFTAGFRKTFLIFPIAYFLTFISISVNNFNLGVFSLLLVCFVCFSYYFEPENEYYIWNSNLNSKEFLLDKIKTCCIYFSFLCLPILISLGIYFYENLDILIFFSLLSYIYLITFILGKYSAYPYSMNLYHLFCILICMVFAPFLIGVAPLFYSQAIKKLKPLLND